jgi:cell wall-associated NlpC family hydrolase
MRRHPGAGAVALVLALAGGGAASSSASASPVAPGRTVSAAAQPAYVSVVPEPAGCLVVGPAVVGVKVYLVQKSLGLVNHHEVYDAATKAAVTAFQRAQHLAATGLVDRTTWTTLATGKPFCVDRYTAQPTVRPAGPASDHVAAMIAYAKRQIGLPYIWGGAGPIGYDCSGLSLQALYAGGRVVPGVTTDKHVQPSFNTARAIYTSTALKHVPLGRRRPGDLIFWGNDFHHMAIYLGADTIVEAVRPKVHKASLWAHGALLPTVVRPTG